MRVLQAIGAVVVLVLFFLFGFSWRDVQKGSAPSVAAFATLVGVDDSGEALPPSMLFRQTYQKILNDYYKPVDPKKLKYAGISGMMASLGDPHTLFLEPRAAREFNLETKANFVGVGARLAPDPLGAEVAVIFDGGPAEQAGLAVGDIIVGVDGKTASNSSIDAIVDQIRGKEGTTVKLKVLKGGVGQPVQITARRAHVVTPTVESKKLKGTDFGYISVSMFSEPTAEQFDRAIDKLDKEGIKGLIIDVRGNPGGLLDTAVEMLSRFVENKVVVKMKGKDGREEIATTFSGAKKPFGYPVIVIQNEDSASASEIFAGVLRDYRLATLVGEHSYGKASVQNVRALRDQSSAKITVARYYLPSGQDIGRRVDEDGTYVSGGIPPDVKVELSPDKSVIFGDPATDDQLKKAIEILRSKV